MAAPIAFKKTEIAPNVYLSQVGFGTAPIGGLGTDVTEASGVAALKQGMAMGVNYLDSALLYGGGKGLETLGIALGENPPKDMVISFKVGRVLVTGPDDPNARGKTVHTDDVYVSKPQYVFDYSADGVQKAFDQSMRHLNAGRARHGMRPLTPQELNIAIYVHDPDVRVHTAEHQPAIMQQVMAEAYPKLWEMQQAGLIKAYGIGTNEVGTCIESLKDEHIKLLMLAGRGTLLCNDAPVAPEEIKRDSRLLDVLATKMKTHANAPKLVIAAIGNSSLGYGGKTYNYAPASPEVLGFRDMMQARLDGYNDFHGSRFQMTDLLVRYPIDYLGDSVAAVVSGPRSPEEAEQVAQAYDTKLPPALWQHIANHGLLNNKLQLGGGVDAGSGIGDRKTGT